MTKWTADELNSYQKGAEAGDIQCQIFLGWAFVEGKFVEKDYLLAKKWLDQATNQGSKEAAYRTAMLLILQKDKTGIEILTDLSAENYAPAMYELGNCYYMGIFVERDASLARQYWERAADCGHALARIKLLKYLSKNSPVYMKPVIFVRLLWAVLFGSTLLLKDYHGSRTLGTLR